MGNFRRDNRSQGSQGRRDFGERRERPELFHAVCANCGNDCEVPFKPTGSKPVFCRNCFDKQGGSDRGGRSNFSRDSRGPRDSRGGRDSDRPMFDAVCDNCGNKCRIPFQPRDDKPVFCSDCFEKKGGDPRTAQNRASNQPNYQEKFDALNAKLDRILAILEPIVSLEADQVELTEEPVEEPKEKAPKKKAKKDSKKEVVLTPEVESEVKEN
jgi:CxxC-x17-CxxC domain-containing protein